jgi:hypothetical protein
MNNYFFNDINDNFQEKQIYLNNMLKYYDYTH